MHRHIPPLFIWQQLNKLCRAPGAADYVRVFPMLKGAVGANIKTGDL